MILNIQRCTLFDYCRNGNSTSGTRTMCVML